MESYSTFEAFRPHFESLARAAYFKVVKRPVSPVQRILHGCYRVAVWVFVITYNLQHVVTFVQARSVEEMAGTLFILLTTLGSLGKQVTFQVRSHRVERLIALVDDPVFAPVTPHDVAVMKSNATSMHRLLLCYQRSIFVCGTLWIIFPLVNRALGQDVKLTGYFPFDTSYSPSFELALIYLCFNISLQGYANVTMDCTIVSFYSQARVQIKILRNNLEHLLDGVKDSNDMNFITHGRLGKCVEHFRQITGLCKEVESVFFEAMFAQFFMMAWVICMTVYRIVGVDLMSAEFVSIVMYLCCLLAQLFLFCYYGTLLKNESELVNQSVYCCDWLSLSPAFRRQLLLMMECCRRPITPRIASLVPITLDTFITILKSSYSLFTFVDRRSVGST